METFSQSTVAAPSRAERRAAVRARDLAVATIAAAQHGVITAEQFEGCGFEPRDRQERHDRTLFAVCAGVYAVGHPGLSRKGRAAAGLLRAGEEAGLSHDSAARLWGMERRSVEGPVHVSVIGRPTLPTIAGVQFHRPESLTTGDLTIHRDTRVTTPERTVLDLLPHRSEAQIAGILEQMVTVLGRDPDDLAAWVAGLRGVHGLNKLRRAADDLAGPAVVRSELEALFREVCREGGVPLPQANVRIGGLETDAVWIQLRIAVELDSWRFHGGRWQFHRDRDKGLVIAREGYELIRLTWRQLKRDRAAVVATLLAVIERAAARTA